MSDYPKDVARLKAALPELLTGIEPDAIEALYHWWSEEMNHASWLNISEGVPEEFGAWLSNSPSPALVRSLSAEVAKLRAERDQLRTSWDAVKSGCEAAAANVEREACAQLVEQYHVNARSPFGVETKHSLKPIADDIRARGKP